MNQKRLTGKDLLLFLLALLGLAIYIVLYPQLFPQSALRITLDQSAIDQRATEILSDLGYDMTKFGRRVALRQDVDQIRYLQQKFGLKRTNEIIAEQRLPIYFWKITFQLAEMETGGIRIITRDNEAASSSSKAPSDTISISLSLQGDLIDLSVQLGKRARFDTLSLEEARNRANFLLQKFQPERFSYYQLLPVGDNNRYPVIEHHFNYESQRSEYGEKQTAAIAFTGQYVTKLKLDFKPPEGLATSRQRSEWGIIPAMITFIAIFIIFLIQFIRRLRRDEIDLRSNVVLSVIISLATIFMMLQGYHEGERNLLDFIVPILFTGPFVFTGFLIVSSISEANARDIWEEKLLTFDALKRGTILFPQFSLAIWRGTAAAWIALGAVSLVIKIGNLAVPLSMSPTDSLSNKLSFWPVAFACASALMTTGFYEFIFRLFFASAFRSRVQKTVLIVLLAGLIWAFSTSSYNDVRISPLYLNFGVNFVVGMLFVAFLLQYDFVTVWWGALFYFLLRELYPLTFFDRGFFFWNGLSVWILFALVLVITYIGYRRRVEMHELQKYVPSYLIRRAERERIQRELEIARRVQLSFLPRTKPRLAGIDVASVCIPAMEVGGDYYDFVELDDHRLGIVIGDVSNKGISAAFHMTLTKGFLKSQAKTGLAPREIMIHLNELFYENVERGTFISMIYGVFDLHRRTFTFARAGHNPIILQKAGDLKVD
ncbi:MAG: SpoIIE family protein phosphatase, partial [candidate division KSB1 bacterium]|nr:SpoIIE family protein phosphatase [candidate division KSB1 bacterium]